MHFAVELFKGERGFRNHAGLMIVAEFESTAGIETANEPPCRLTERTASVVVNLQFGAALHRYLFRPSRNEIGFSLKVCNMGAGSAVEPSRNMRS